MPSHTFESLPRMNSSIWYLAHIWHERYSVPKTNYFGQFACKKLLKMTGILSKCQEALEAGQAPQEGKQGEDLDQQDDDYVYHFHGRMGTRGVCYGVRRQERQILYGMMQTSFGEPIKVTRIVRTWMEEWRCECSLQLGMRSFQQGFQLRTGV